MASYENSELVDRLIAEAEKSIAVAFGDVVLALQGQFGLKELARLLEQGRFDEALGAIDDAAAKIANAVNNIYVNAGIETLDEMGDKLGVFVSFDQTNLRALKLMAENRLELIKQFTQKQRDAASNALRYGMERGLNPRATARLFRESVGLTSNQMQYVLNYEEDLRTLNPRALQRKLRDGRFDPSVKKAIRDGTPLSEAQIGKMVGRYRDRWVSFRAETIARHESLAAVHEGTLEAIQQAVDSGAVEAQNAKSTWNTSRDDRVRDFEDGPTSHVVMHHQTLPFGESFISGAGNKLRYPGDRDAPLYDTGQCRCRVGTRVSN